MRMTTARRLSNINSTPSYSHVPNDEEDLPALPTFPEDRLEFPATSSAQQTVLNSSTSLDSSTSTHVAVEHGGCFKRCSRTILMPLTLILSCLLLPSAVLLALTMYYRVDAGKSLFETSEDVTNMHMVYV